MNVSTDSHAFGPSWRTLAGIAVFLELIALFILLDARGLPEPNAVGVGPAVAMYVVAFIVAVLGLAHGVSAWVRRVREVEEGFTPREASPATNHAALAWILGGLGALGASVAVGGGFILGATALFVGTARAFGQPVATKSVLIGLLITTLVFLFFARALSLTLPAGPLEALLLA